MSLDIGRDILLDMERETGTRRELTDSLSLGMSYQSSSTFNPVVESNN